MKLRILAVVLTLMPLPQVAVAQQVQQGALLQQVYVLWGMMDGAANFCWEAANFDVRLHGGAPELAGQQRRRP